MGRVTINGSVAQASCKLTIAKGLWDAKGNRAKGKGREAFVTAEMVRNAFQGLGTEYDTLPERQCMANCMWLKTIVTKAHYNGLTPRNPFAQYRTHRNRRCNSTGCETNT